MLLVTLLQSRLHAQMQMHMVTLSFLYSRLALGMYLYIQLEQCHEAVHQHKRCTLFISTLDAHISCQLAVCAPTKLAPSNVAKEQNQNLENQRNNHY